MPKLDWIGKQAVIRHHLEVPYRLIHCDGALSTGEPSGGNLLVQGDNLEALKSLLPFYAGKVKCVYIDPPYNTGNEKWHYNDNVNSPQIRRWLHKVVGSENEDLCRHDKWLCMMYPRLKLLKKFLSQDGAIFVSIDGNEVHRLRMVMDDIFGERNSLALITWQGMDTIKSDARYFSSNSEFILAYARSIESIKIAGIPKTEKQRKYYKNYDNDPRGDYLLTPLHAKSGSENSIYTYTFPNGQKWTPPKGVFPRFSKENLSKMVEEGRIYLDPKGKKVPQRKTFWSEVSDRMRPTTFWGYKEFGSTRQSNMEIREILGRGSFDNAKPTRLIKIILDITADKNALILDSFAGSGTTAQAVLELNKEDGGSRKFVLIQCDEWDKDKKREVNICKDITGERIRRVIRGVKTASNELLRNGLGGSFRYCKLGKPLFDQHGQISKEVKFSDLAAHVFFSETGSPIPQRASGKTPLLGVFKDCAIYLLYNGVMGDKRTDSGNVLTTKVLSNLPPSPKGMKRIIYADGCRLGQATLNRKNIVMRKMPYNIKTK